MILQSFSNVTMVMFLPFFSESKVLLSIPPFKSWYCDTCIRSIVFHSGS